MNFRRELPSMRSRILMVAVAVFTVIGVAAFPRIAHAAPVVTVGNANVTEGHTGTSPVVVTFTLSEDNSSAVSATYQTQNGTATANNTASDDYVIQNGTVDFAPHETSKQVTFYARGDQVDEADETFKVVITGVTGGGASGTNNFGTVTILDDDQPPGAGVADEDEDEGTSAGTDTTAMEFTVRLSGPAPAGGVTYSAFTRDPQHDTDDVKPGNQFRLAATAGADYTALNGTAVTIAAGQSSAPVFVQIKRDSIDEYDQYFELYIKNSGGAEVDWANGKIVDDDALSRLDVSDPAPFTEGDTTCGGVTGPTCPVMTFTVTRTGATEKRMVVDYATENRSAISPEDYTAQSGSGDPDDATSDGTGLVFAPGDTFKTVDVPIKGDTKAEADERFVLNLSNPINAQLGDAQAFGLIRNDDGGSLASISIADPPATTEGTAAAPGTTTFTISAVRTSQTDTGNYTVYYQTADGPETGTGAKAVAGSDYVAKTGSVNINWPATSATVPVTLIGDAKNESDEFFQLQLTDVSNANIVDPVGEAKITDDDPAPTLSIADKTNPEGTSADPPTAPAPLTVTLSPASGQTVTVVCSTPKPNSGTATMDTDYTETNQTVTFVPGDTSEDCNIPVVGDTMDENSETVAVALKDAVGATISDGAAVLTITDDDNPPTITIDSAPVTEGSSTNSTAILAVDLSEPSAKPITVSVATANGTATTPSDYTAKNETLTFNPGESTKDFKVTVIADTLNEANETFTATLSNPNANATLGSPSTGTATIEDDDDSPSLSIDNVTVTEGDSGTTNATFTVTLSPGSAQTVTVHYATADDTATTAGNDYTATSGDLSFPPGNQAPKQITVPVKGDTVDETDETFSVALSAPTNATISDGTGVGTITDNDGPGVPPAGFGPKITTGPGPGGGPHIRVFQPNGTDTGVGFMDGSDATGKRVARGDLDGDGVDEIITGSGPNSPAGIAVYSATGAPRTSAWAYAGGTFYGGVFVAAGDLDNDGKDEIVTAAGPGGGPHVRVWKLVNGSLTGNDGFMAYNNWNGGASVAVADVNKDGLEDIITGAGAGGGPHVKAFNGAGPVEMFGFMAFDSFNGGVNLAAGDLDGDGFAEIVIGAGPGGGPHLRLFNHDGTLRNGGIFAGASDFRGGINVAVGDLDDVASTGEIVVSTQSLGNVVRGYKADLSSLSGTNFQAYPGFNGGVYVAIGES